MAGLEAHGEGACLVVRFGRLGDMLVVTPVLRALDRHRPDATIDVLTSAESRAVLANNPHIDRIFTLRSRRVPRAINVERLRLERKLRERAYDTVFLLEGAQRYRDLVSRIDPRRTLTFARRDETPDAMHAERHAHHELYNFFAVLALAGVQPDGEHYEFPLSDDAHARARVILLNHGREDTTWIGVHTGFHQRRLQRNTHPKAWPIERWRVVIQQLGNQPGRKVVLTGSPREHVMNERILAGLPKGTALNLAGETDLDTLGALIAECSLFIAPDTGPAHLAAAVGTPLIALFGPKPPHIMGPRGDDRIIVRLWPEPSTAAGNDAAGYHPRMWAITVEDVLDAVDRLLGARA